MSLKDIIESDNVQSLIKVMNLRYPKETLLVSDYEYIDNRIVIREIQVLDLSGKIIRTADLSRVEPYLKKMNIGFM
tara:strand:+ start:953 stop:1180 length:228 start_codon:yes stop_codon:yes gene_type:complete